MFKSDLADIGTILPGQKVKVKWEMLGKPDDIVHWQPDCGCTAEIRKEGQFFVAEFTESDAEKLSQEQKDQWYPSGKMPITKGIWVYLNDGRDLNIIQDGKTILNPEKEKMKLTFIGYALLKPVQADSQHQNILTLG